MAKKKKEVVVLDAEIIEEITTPDFSDTEIYTGPGKKPQGSSKKDYPKFTPETRETILQLVGGGSPENHAVNIAGIHIDTLYRWLERGRMFQGKIDDGFEDELELVDKDFANFHTAFYKVKSTPIVVLLQGVMKAARGDPDNGINPNPTLALRLLEKLDPEQFGQKSAVDIRQAIKQDVRVIGAGGSVKQLAEGEEIVKQLSTEELRFLRADYQKRRAARMLAAGDEEDAE